MTSEESQSGGESAIEAARRAKLQRIIELGVDPYGGRFDDRLSVADIRDSASSVILRGESGDTLDVPELEKREEVSDDGEVKSHYVVAVDGEEVEFRQWLSTQGKAEFVGPTVRAAGRIVLQREQGNLRFIDIQDWTGRIQLFIGKKQVGPENWELIRCLDLGDLIGVDGELKRTKTGELSIFATEVHVLCKTLDPPPGKRHGVKDAEMRQRMRYVDLAYSEGSLDRFLNRTRIVQSIRHTLADTGFVEVEGPTLHTIAGGAAARPFVTHHNALDMKLFMRIALELHLKRLLVGGVERVYELGRVYRNEGISPRHNPEFTMLEAYQAYGDYRSMMDLTERLILDAIDAIGAPRQLPWGEKTIDFSPPFARRTYDELFAENTGIDPHDEEAIRTLAGKIGFETAGKHVDVIKNEIFEEKVEDALVGPIFVIDYPASICPLTKRKKDNPAVAERFELFIQGMEIANAYTELNDPDLQQELFETQLAGQAEEDSMAKMDHDFIRALRNGMPPAGGLGVGIDRLVMLLTNSQSIRDVILFPVLRPEASSARAAEAESETASEE
ncbi:lysine--tRNA ligase [Lignipirellula cremea]|uniref:Lysine--tRNA ligase n=1 Tax=Lignipirellula cremea TaxID=2528010 RepID=A0A518DLS4_9BACT|nr:lysine--tRNA ligase [Lignipirellula cremea]QDU92773.1 Lysine--tRNA ligase [Lignipirellula cremea]